MAISQEDIVSSQKLNQQGLKRLAAERGVILPDVPMTLDYQPDVDLLSIRFARPVAPDAIADDDELGVIGIYNNGELVGVEIVDATGNLENAHPQ